MHVRVPIILAAVALSPVSVLAGPTQLDSAPRPQAVAGGEPVETCGWPTTVAVTGSGSLCTGTLVHPRVITYAAHCGDSNKRIRFGEDSLAATTVDPVFCRANPEYLGTSDQANDWAFCVLDEPVPLPVTPPAQGCEHDLLEPDAEVAIVGFGDDTDTGGAGTKRWAMTTINTILGNTTSIGGDGVGTCSGDSGGSAFVQVDEGTWRAFSMVSTGVGCGQGGIHSLIRGAIPWIEENADIDITPCFDDDGNWRPTPSCAGFFAGGATGYGDWGGWCDGTPTGEASATCGDPFDANDDADAPIVTITEPADGTRFDGAPAEVDLLVDADDGDGWGVASVKLEINGMEQDLADEHAPFAFGGASFPKGVFTVVAIAEDFAGNVGRSEPVRFGVDEDVPEDTDTGTGSGETTTDGTDGGSSGATSEPESTGTGAGAGGGGSGCACAATPRSTSTAWWLLVPYAVYRRRRR